MTIDTFQELLWHAAELCDCTPLEILRDCREREAVRAREMVTLVCHEFHRLRYPEIAAMFNRKSHSTFVDGHKRIKARVAGGPARARVVETGGAA